MQRITFFGFILGFGTASRSFLADGCRQTRQPAVQVTTRQRNKKGFLVCRFSQRTHGIVHQAAGL